MCRLYISKFFSVSFHGNKKRDFVEAKNKKMKATKYTHLYHKIIPFSKSVKIRLNKAKTNHMNMFYIK